MPRLFSAGGGRDFGRHLGSDRQFVVHGGHGRRRTAGYRANTRFQRCDDCRGHHLGRLLRRQDFTAERHDEPGRSDRRSKPLHAHPLHDVHHGSHDAHHIGHFCDPLAVQRHRPHGSIGRIGSANHHHTLQHFAAAVHRAGHRNRNDRPENAARTGALHRRNPGRDPRADLPTVGHRPTERRRGTDGRRSLPGHHQSNVRYHLDEHGRSGSRCPVHFERDGRDAEHRLVDRHRDDFRRSNGSRPFSRTPDLCPDPARTLDRGAGNDHRRNLRPVQHDRIGPIHCDRHPRQDVCESLPAKRTGARSAEPYARRRRNGHLGADPVEYLRRDPVERTGRCNAYGTISYLCSVGHFGPSASAS